MHFTFREFVTRAGLGAVAAILLGAASVRAQEPLCPCPPPSPPPPVWKGALGGGVSLTGGNTDTRSYNVDFALIRDPKKKDVFKADGFYLRTDTDGEAAVDRTALGARYERALGKSARSFAFGEVRYLRDVFKDVDHLITPTVGAGYRFVNRERLKASADAGVGLAFEQLTGRDATTDGAVSGAENVLWKLSKNASFVQAARGLWKIDDFGDAYYHFDAGILASLARRFDLKLSFADDYKTRPLPGNEKNDTAVLATIVFKI
jgi:putative salt-induced outer membrane protein YdiY